MHIFGIDYTTISRALTALVNHLTDTFTPLLTDNLEFFVSRFLLYRQSILNAHAANGDAPPFGLEDVIGFVDATMNFINRPGGGFQRAVFSGKSKRHCLKSQSNKFKYLIISLCLVLLQV